MIRVEGGGRTAYGVLQGLQPVEEMGRFTQRQPMMTSIRAARGVCLELI